MTTRPPGSSIRLPPPPEWQQAIDSFLEFHRVHRGVSPATLEHYRAFLPRFALHASPLGASIRLDQLTASHIDAFLVEYAGPRGRAYVRHTASSLRTFLRYLALLGHVPAELAAQVPRPRAYRLAGLPRALGRDDLRRVLRGVDRRDPRGRREYAILMLLASYGLRISDVAALLLDDLHWREGTLAITMEKTGRPLILPLTDAVGDALADYLQRSRPPSDHREVFLSLARPFRSLSRARIGQLVRQAMDRVGVQLHGVAAHAFRHGLATHLVRSGVPLDTVASCLGHSSSETTFIYTKLSVEDLRSVSLDPREVIP